MEKMIGDVVCIINETLPVSAEGPFASPRAPRQNSAQPHPYISFFIPAGETGHLVEYLTGKSDVAPRAKTIKAFPEITRTSGRSSKRCYLHPTQSTSEFTESQLPRRTRPPEDAATQHGEDRFYYSGQRRKVYATGVRREELVCLRVGDAESTAARAKTNQRRLCYRETYADARSFRTFCITGR